MFDDQRHSELINIIARLLEPSDYDLYLNLFELRPKDRLGMLQLINELIASSAKTASDLIEEEHREEDEL